jgi:hypothetical protein
MRLITKMYVRAARTKVWHESVDAGDNRVTTRCGLALQSSETAAGRGARYDMKRSWPGSSRDARCGSCRESRNT